MASPTLSKAVAGVQSALIHFQTVAAGVGNRAIFRLPQKSQIVRVGASYRASNATDLQIMVEADGVNLLTGVIDMVQTQPTAPVAVDPNVGGGINLGAHSWRVTFVTATGESAGSAKSNVITLAAPTAPTGTENPINGAIELGTHSYKVTAVNAAGESVISAKSNVVTLAAPAAPVAAEVPVAGAVELGTHSYKIGFVNAGGESVSSAKSNVVTLAAPLACTAALAGLGAGNVNNGDHSYKVTFVGPAGESVASPKSNVVTTAAGDGQVALTDIPVGPAGTTDRNIYRTDAGDAAPWKLIGSIADNVTTTFADNVADGAGAAAPADTGSQIELTGIPAGPAGTTGRNVYRTVSGDAGDWLLVGLIPDNVTATYLDNVADGALGAAAPTATGGRINVTAIPVGPAGTTGRNLYRTATGDAGPWLLVAAIADNTTVAFADNVADGALGAAAPAATGGTATVTIPTGPTGTVSRKVYRTDAGDGGDHKLVATVANNTTTTITDTLADGAGAAAPTADTRMEGEFSEGTLEAGAAAIDKETEITVDVDTLTGTDVSDLCVQIDFVRLD